MRALITGGAGYIGSMLSATLLSSGHDVVVVDKLLFGGDSLLPFFRHPKFSFHKRDVTDEDLAPLMDGADVVYHLAAIVGFPACQEVGEEVARRFNVDATRRVFEAAERGGVARFVFASTYSNYGLATGEEAVTEESPLFPQSLYAQTKIEAEEYLRSRCGFAVRERHPAIHNALRHLTADTVRPAGEPIRAGGAHEPKARALSRDYRRAFVHVGDVVRALALFATAPIDQVRGQVFNVGHEFGNHTKSEIVQMVRDAVPAVDVEYRDLSFGGDMRDVAVDCRKIHERLGFRARITVADGIREVRDAIASGLIREPTSPRYRNHTFIVH